MPQAAARLGSQLMAAGLVSRLDVLKTALKAANNKILELHHALAAQSQLQVSHTVTHTLERNVGDMRLFLREPTAARTLCRRLNAQLQMRDTHMHFVNSVLRL